MSEKSSTFVGMNDEMKLRLAYAESKHPTPILAV